MLLMITSCMYSLLKTIRHDLKKIVFLNGRNIASYLVETMLAVHLTVEEGLKLKIAMKGGLREKIRGKLC